LIVVHGAFPLLVAVRKPSTDRRSRGEDGREASKVRQDVRARVMTFWEYAACSARSEGAAASADAVSMT
jgi:hypothetical protein